MYLLLYQVYLQQQRIGVIDPADQFMGLTGQEVSVDQGTAVAPNEDVSVTGQAITSAQGTAQGVTSHEADLTDKQ